MSAPVRPGKAGRLRRLIARAPYRVRPYETGGVTVLADGSILVPIPAPLQPREATAETYKHARSGAYTIIDNWKPEAGASQADLNAFFDQRLPKRFIRNGDAIRYTDAGWSWIQAPTERLV